MSYDTELCGDACKNPHCPYITQINLNTQANAESRQVIVQINKAIESLLGEDLTGLNSGVIRTLLIKLVSSTNVNSKSALMRLSKRVGLTTLKHLAPWSLVLH